MTMFIKGNVVYPPPRAALGPAEVCCYWCAKLCSSVNWLPSKTTMSRLEWGAGVMGAMRRMQGCSPVPVTITGASSWMEPMT